MIKVAHINVQDSSWLALRVRASYQDKNDNIAAHSSAVQVIVANQPLFSQQDAMTVLEQIEGSIAYVDTLAKTRGQAL